MSLAELLPAIRALPRAEQVQLLHLLVDGVAEAPPAPTVAPSAEEQLLAKHGIHFPPGFVAEVWFPTLLDTDAAGWSAIGAALNDIQKGRQ